jgi:hypothetical protein
MSKKVQFLMIFVACTLAGAVGWRVLASPGSTSGASTVVADHSEPAPTGANPPSSSGASPIVWVVGNLDRVGQTDAPGTTSSVTFSGARGEYIDTQIAIQGPAGGLTNVNVAVTDLVGPGGAVISKSNFDLYREHYVSITSGSYDYGPGANRPLPPGIYPDGLMPFNDPETGASLAGNGAALQAVPFNVAAGQNQVIWIDLFIPRGVTNSPPGTYTGDITITSTQGNVTVPVSLSLWNFELPLVPSEKTFFMIFFPANGNSHNEQMILRHRISLRYVQIADVPSGIANFGMNRTALWGYAPSDGCGSVSTPPTLAQFRATAAQYPPGLALDVYPADEISGCTSAYPLIKQWAQNAHAVGAKVVTTMIPDPALYDDGSGTGQPAVDFWVLLPNQWRNFSGVPGAIWSYNTEVQDSYSPKWEIDFLPINFRIHAGFLNQTQGATGLLYWAVDYWQNPSTVWDNPVVSNIYGNFPGDGILIYPGTQVGTQAPAPSMRLKWLRDGIQDYEYIEMLKKTGQASWALSQASTIAHDWVNWSQSSSALLQLRDTLGQKLSDSRGKF